MNPVAAESGFRAGIERLLDDFDHKNVPDAASPRSYVKDKVIHEHETRVFFFDRLLQLLGWDLGVGENVTQDGGRRGPRAVCQAA